MVQKTLSLVLGSWERHGFYAVLSNKFETGIQWKISIRPARSLKGPKNCRQCSRPYTAQSLPTSCARFLPHVMPILHAQTLAWSMPTYSIYLFPLTVWVFSTWICSSSFSVESACIWISYAVEELCRTKVMARQKRHQHKTPKKGTLALEVARGPLSLLRGANRAYGHFMAIYTFAPELGKATDMVNDDHFPLQTWYAGPGFPNHLQFKPSHTLILTRFMYSNNRSRLMLGTLALVKNVQSKFTIPQNGFAPWASFPLV